MLTEMKAVPKQILTWLWLWLPLTLLLPGCSPDAERHKTQTQTFNPEWQVLWESGGTEPATPAAIKNNRDWKSLARERESAIRPKEAASAWFRTTLPELIWKRPAISLERVEGLTVLAYLDESLLYESRRDYMYTSHKILLPIHREDAGKTLYLRIDSPGKSHGMEGSLKIGEYEKLRGEFIRKDLSDFVMGSTFLFIAVVMFFCLFFLPRHYRSSWLALTAVSGSSGILLITYTPFLSTFFADYGKIWVTMFDLALFVLFPSLTFYFEKIYGPGPFGLIRRFRIFQSVYSAGCAAFMTVNLIGGNRYHDIYYVFSVQVLGLIMILQMLLLIGVTAAYAAKKNKDAYIFSIGFVVLAAASLADLISFYAKNGDYHFYLWNWGVLGFIVSLIVMIGVKFMRSHEQVVRYSKELELFNNELQRSEKMEIISELAASVAHEVRNPLQVTRGFMQLLTEKSNAGQQEYLGLALKELDRASAIITDFLTFAKPEMEQISLLNLSEELRHVAGILHPLANLEGGTIQLDVPNDIYIAGNSSKLKQAMINLVKNSIEALNDEGTVKIWAMKDRGKAVIYIRDNGIGMDMNELSRLGEPYFSNKTKGTGLGLMVTFRIIEAMNGKILFTSHKGIGTEVMITIPLAEKPREMEQA